MWLCKFSLLRWCKRRWPGEGVTMTDKVAKMENGKAGAVPLDPAEKEKPFGPITWKALLLIGVLIYGSYTILVHLCEIDGRMPFSSASSVLCTEVLKLILSIGMFIPEAREKGFERPSFMFILPFSVPAILYCINNNVGVHMQLQMDPATYQVLGNLKIFSTALLYRLIIKRPITGIQWVALTLLALAGACNSYGGLKAGPEAVSAGEIHLTVKGLVMISFYCFISGLSGVYTEFILKKRYEMTYFWPAQRPPGYKV